MKSVPLYLQMPINTKLSTQTSAPKRAYASDAGADLFVSTTTLLLPHKRTLVPLGVHVEIPIGYVGLLFPRSSLSKLDVTMTNSVGVIDAGYLGEVMASLMYIGDSETGICLSEGDKVVQLLIMPIILPIFNIVDELSETERGSGGFGSTGR